MCTKKFLKVFGLFLVVGLLFAVAPTRQAQAATICVNPGGTDGCFASIQAAITAAADGDTITVGPGTYVEAIVINKPNLTIQSTAGAQTTIIDAGGAVMAVQLENNLGTITFDGFSVTNFTEVGIAQSMFKPNTIFHVLNNKVVATGDFLRNGINVSGSGSTIIGNTVIGATYNNPSYGSSGIIVVNASNVSIQNNNISGTPEYGITVNNWSNTTPMTNVVVSGNTIEGADYGVVIWANDTYSIDGVTLTGNTITDYFAPVAVVGTVSNVATLPPVANVTSGDYFYTIQEAVNAASANDVIEVGAGTYTESLDVNKGVTLRAADLIETVVLSDTEAPGVWYPDRYRPAVFQSATWQGRNAIKHGVRAADSLENRPAAYQYPFYNTQGRKYQTSLTGSVQRMSIDMWVDSAWSESQAYSGLWSTGVDSIGAVYSYPIIAWRSTTGETPGFYIWDYRDDVGGWTLVKAAEAGDYGKWHTLAFELRVGEGVQYYLDGQPVGALLPDTVTVSLENVILNVYNYGADYDVYWDNFSTSGVSIVGQTTVNASNVTVDGFNLSNPNANFGMLVNPDFSNVTITGNIFENIGGTAMTDNVKGVYLLSGPDNVTIEGNIFRNIQSGTKSANAVYSGDSNATDPATSLVIRNNVFENITSASWGSYGILLNNGTGNPGVVIEGNTFDGISGAWARGVGLEGPTAGALVDDNVFSNITTPTEGYNAGIFFEDNPGLETTLITNNQFLLDGFGVAVHPDMVTHATVLATPNWWGQASGPAAGQLPTIGDYDYSPWCANAACTEFLPATITIAPVAPVVCGVTPTTTIDVNISGIPASMVAQGYQLTLHFDPTKTSITSSSDIVQGGFLPVGTGFQVLDIDNTTGKVVIASTIYGAATNDSTKPLVKITLTHLGLPGDIALSLSDVLLSDKDGFVIPSEVSATATTLKLQPAVLNITKNPDVGYCDLASAVAAADANDNLQLQADITIPTTVTVDKALTLDLNGKVATFSTIDLSYAITVDGTSAALTVKDTSTEGTGKILVVDADEDGNTDGRGIGVISGSLTLASGTIQAPYAGVYVRPGTSMVMNGGTIGGSVDPLYGIVILGTGSSLDINSGVIESTYFAVSGNGTAGFGGTTITIDGGTLTSTTAAAIYHPQDGNMTITGGTISGINGIEMKAGNLVVTGGTILGTGAYADPVANDNGSVETGDAILLNGRDAYTGDITVNITGGTITSTNAYALREYKAADQALKTSAVLVSGGSFTGGTGKQAVTFSDAFVALPRTATTGLMLTGGLYNTDPADPDVFVFVPYGTVLNGTMYEIVGISLNVNDFYYNNSGTLRGVSTDFYANNFLFSSATSVEVRLYAGEEGSYVLQQTNVLKLPTTAAGVLTSSFDYFGTYVSNSWTNTEASTFDITAVPTHVEVTVVLPGGTLDGFKDLPTGDRASILPGVNGLVTLQGILAPKADVKITLTAGSVVRDTLSTALSDINYGFTGVETLTYTFTTSQARYLNVTADSGKIFLVDRDRTLNPLRLFGGDVNQDDKIEVNDASIVGTYWGSTANPNGNVNFDSIVNIQDLALVGGNYGLISETAYSWWSPLP